jgi:hypothetical protein
MATLGQFRTLVWARAGDAATPHQFGPAVIDEYVAPALRELRTAAPEAMYVDGLILDSPEVPTGDSQDMPVVEEYLDTLVDLVVTKLREEAKTNKPRDQGTTGPRDQGTEGQPGDAAAEGEA